jgi:hypothetical protein
VERAEARAGIDKRDGEWGYGRGGWKRFEGAERARELAGVVELEDGDAGFCISSGFVLVAGGYERRGGACSGRRK